MLSILECPLPINEITMYFLDSLCMSRKLKRTQLQRILKTIPANSLHIMLFTFTLVWEDEFNLLLPLVQTLALRGVILTWSPHLQVH